MLKEQKDFNEVLLYTKYVGFKNKAELETYLKKKGFGVNYLNFYTDSEENDIAFKVDFLGNKVVSVEAVVFPFSFKMLKEFDAVYFG